MYTCKLFTDISNIERNHLLHDFRHVLPEIYMSRLWLDDELQEYILKPAISQQRSNEETVW